MNEYSDNSDLLKQDNEKLKKQNEDLAQQLETIKKATAELEKFREGAAIEKIAKEARNKVLAGFGILGALSIAGLFGVYLTVLNTVKEKILDEKTFPQIQTKVEEGLKDKKYLDAIAANLSQDISKKLGDSFKQDKNFKQDVVKAVSEKLLNDKEFTGIFKANVNSAVDIAVAKVAKVNPDTELAIAINQTIEGKKYFVVAASSEDTGDLQNIDLVNKIQSNKDRDVYVCKPKEGNKRSVLLVTKKSSKEIKLPLDSAKFIQDEIKKIPEFDTAYILPTIDENNIFFDIKKCEVINSK
jgi:hypothetical protein